MQEGRVQAALQHPNIVSVTDVVVVDSAPGLVMEYIRGPAMDDCLDALELTNDQIDSLAVGVLDGVAAAHALDLIHRDLKPANVMLAVTHDAIVPKVADFGLVKLLAGDDDGFQSKTRSGSTMGTPAYMAPEQIRDSKNVDARADVWSLGAILFELVTGRRAFDGEDVLDLFMKVAGGERETITDICDDLPERWVKAIEGSLVVDRGDRIATVADLRAQWLDGATRQVSSPWDETILEAARKLGSGGDNTKDFLRRSFKSTMRARRKKVDTGKTEVPSPSQASDDSFGGPTMRAAPGGSAPTMALEGQTAVPVEQSGTIAPPVDTLVPQTSSTISSVETLAPDHEDAGVQTDQPATTGRVNRRVLAAAAVGLLLMVSVSAAVGFGALAWYNVDPDSWTTADPQPLSAPIPGGEPSPATNAGELDPPEPDGGSEEVPEPGETPHPSPGTADPVPGEAPAPAATPDPAPEGTPDPAPDETPDPAADETPEPATDSDDGVAEAPEESPEPSGLGLPPPPSQVTIDAADMTVILKDSSGRKTTLGRGGRVVSGTYTVVAFFEPRVATEVERIDITPGSSWSIRCLKSAGRCIVKQQ